MGKNDKIQHNADKIAAAAKGAAGAFNSSPPKGAPSAPVSGSAGGIVAGMPKMPPMPDGIAKAIYTYFRRLDDKNDPHGFLRACLRPFIGEAAGAPASEDMLADLLEKVPGIRDSASAYVKQDKALKILEQASNNAVQAAASGTAQQGPAPNAPASALPEAAAASAGNVVMDDGGRAFSQTGSGIFVPKHVAEEAAKKNVAVLPQEEIDTPAMKVIKGEMTPQEAEKRAQDISDARVALSKYKIPDKPSPPPSPAPERMPLYTPEQRAELDRMAKTATRDELTDMMLNYKYINSLDDPESELYKGLMDGTVEQAREAARQKAAEDKEAKGKSAEADRQEYIEKALKRYATPTWLQVANAVGAIAGEGASLLGNMSANYRNGLAEAMVDASSIGDPTASSQQKAMYGDAVGAAGHLTRAAAYGQRAYGQRNKLIGDALNRTIQRVLGGINTEIGMQRQNRAMLEEHPSGLYYQTGWNREKMMRDMYGPSVFI